MMPPEGCERYREWIGAFVLGKLEGVEYEAMQTHINGCAECWVEARELGPVVAALAEADPDRIDEDVRPPDDLEESTLALISEEIHRSRRGSRQRYGWLASAAAAIFAVVIGLAGLTWLVEPAAAVELLSFRTTPGVQPRGYLIAHSWGTEITLAASGLQDGQTYRVRLVSEDKEKVNAGTFIGAGDEFSRGTFTAALSRKDAARVEVRAPGGELAFYSKLPEKPRNKVRKWPLIGVLPWPEPDLKNITKKPGDSGKKKGPGAGDTSPSDTPGRPKAGGSGDGTPPSNESPPDSDYGHGFHGQPPSESPPPQPSASPEPSATPEPSAFPEPSAPPERSASPKPSAPLEPSPPPARQYDGPS
jgi:hypothetical protein